MRISDWSSDVCSSDLPVAVLDSEGCESNITLAKRLEQRCSRRRYFSQIVERGPEETNASGRRGFGKQVCYDAITSFSIFEIFRSVGLAIAEMAVAMVLESVTCIAPPTQEIAARFRFRSEEHTSELQSLMRISYAVFCMKKK